MDLSDNSQDWKIYNVVGHSLDYFNYSELAHLFFSREQQDFIWWELLTGYFRKQPVILYRWGEYTPILPDGLYWQLADYPDLRLYYLESQNQKS